MPLQPPRSDIVTRMLLSFLRRRRRRRKQVSHLLIQSQSVCSCDASDRRCIKGVWWPCCRAHSHGNNTQFQFACHCGCHSNPEKCDWWSADLYFPYSLPCLDVWRKSNPTFKRLHNKCSEYNTLQPEGESQRNSHHGLCAADGWTHAQGVQPQLGVVKHDGDWFPCGE